MDRKSIIGVALIMLIMFGWMYLVQPSKEEIAKQKRMHDSVVELAQKQEAIEKAKTTASQAALDLKSNKPAVNSGNGNNADSNNLAVAQSVYGDFSNASLGKSSELTLENQNIQAIVSTKGGYLKQVILKNYKTSDKKPLILFTADSTQQKIEFITSQNHLFSTNDFIFSQENTTATADSSVLKLRLYDNSKSKYLEYTYSLKGKDNILRFGIQLHGMQNFIASNSSELNLHWQITSPSVEKDLTSQQNASTIYFKYLNDEVDNLNARKDSKKSLETKVQWVSFKEQFFSSILIAEKGFEKPTDVEIATIPNSTKSIKTYKSNLSLAYNHLSDEKINLSFYFGPNHYNTLKTYGLDLEKEIYLGWNIFSYVNKAIVIPTFDFLNRFNFNYGIIILLLTIFIKLLLFPIAYKTYLSSAKMRILKPEIDEINKKHGDDPMKKQQATMALYRQAGVNPLAGCIPVLLQLPILTALFSFFPAAIELRQQSFLWATDLSTYDSILELPFSIPFYGSHVSLFTLLMTVSTLLYTYSNSQLMGGTNDQVPGMKVMMYAMPIFFLGIFNNYSAGLSYYYFLANMITFGQTYLMRKFIDEKALHAKIQENKRKPVKQSNFQKRLEDLAKQRQQQTGRKN